MTRKNMSVMDEISITEEAINSTYDRLHKLEQKLNNDSIPENKKNDFKQELKEVRKLLRTHEQQLSHLRTHNRKTFIVAAGLVFIVFVVYMIYILLCGEAN